MGAPPGESSSNFGKLVMAESNLKYELDSALKRIDTIIAEAEKAKSLVAASNGDARVITIAQQSFRAIMNEVTPSILYNRQYLAAYNDQMRELNNDLNSLSHGEVV